MTIYNNNITIAHYVEYDEELSLSIGIFYLMNWINLDVSLTSRPFYLCHLDAEGLFMFYVCAAVISTSLHVAFLLVGLSASLVAGGSDREIILLDF